MSIHETEPMTEQTRAVPGWVWILGLVAVLAVGWVVYDLATTPRVPPGVDRAIDDYLAAWEARDADAIRAVTSEGITEFQLNEFIYSQGWDPADLDAVRVYHFVDDVDVDSIITGSFPTTQWDTERGGDVVVTGDGPWFVSFPETWIETSDDEVTTLEGIALYVVVEEDGVFRVANHVWSGLDVK